MSSESNSRKGVILLNLGTPAASDPRSVGEFLREFLSDPRAIALPNPLRWFLVNVLIVPRRSHSSAEMYQKIWTERGSPLMFHTQDMTRGLQEELGREFFVAAAMRYGDPSVASAMQAMRENGVDHVVVVPLFPQYATATTGTAEEWVEKFAARILRGTNVTIVPPFFADPGFIAAQAHVARPALSQEYDHVIMTFHGLPEKHVTDLDLNRQHCRFNAECCAAFAAKSPRCYRAQCFATARLLAEALGVPSDKYTVCFQSRFGRAKWLEPDPVTIVDKLREAGKQRLVVLAPSFVTDCLETLEELDIRLRQAVMAGNNTPTAGSFRRAPCVNADPKWVSALARLVQAYI